MELWQIVKIFISEHSELVSFISVAFGFVGIILAFIFYRTSKPVRQLSYAIRTFRIISKKANKIPGLEIKYNGQMTDAISLTRMAIWNGGSEPLRATDIPETDPLIIKARNGVKILKAEVIESSSSSNRPSVQQINDDSYKYKFSFDFLNTGDGVIASFVHNGTGIEDLSLLGTLIGGRIKRTAADPETVTTCAGPYAATTIVNVESARPRLYFMSFMMFIMFIIFAIISFFADEKKPIVIAFVCLLMALGMFFYGKRKYPPSQLRMYDDNL